MASNPYRKVNTGEPLRIPATVWNKILDVVRAESRRAASSRRENSAVSGDRSTCLVDNQSGSDVEMFGVIGIDRTCFDFPTSGTSDEQEQWAVDTGLRLTLRGITPTLADHAGKFVVALAPIKAGAVGRCVCAGVAVAKLEVANAGDEWADVTDGNVSMLTTSATGSARLLYKSGDSGSQWGVVRMGETRANTGFLLVKLTKDGGTQGTATTAASWSYTVTGLDATELGTEVAPEQARAVGVTNYAPDDSYGLAAYDGATLLLLSAYGEYRGKATCPEGA